MVQWADGTNNDHDPNADNYWLFTTDLTIPTTGASTVLNGYSFSPIDAYETNVAVRDGNEDGNVAIVGSPSFHTNDGFAINGDPYEVTQHYTYNATITYADGQVLQSYVIVSRLRADPDNTGPNGPLHGKAVIRFSDVRIQEIYDGPAGGSGPYSLSEITSVTLGAQEGGVINTRSVTGALNDPYPVICFNKSTEIRGHNGPVPVENLQIGDLVFTQDNGLQPIRWIGSRLISEAELTESPNLRPIRIRAGALGLNTPAKDLLVSPHHRILIRSRIAQRMFGTDEVLIAAKHLLEADGIEIAADVTEVEYFHFLFDRHEVIYANGAETESLYTGPEALKAVGPEAQEEIFAIFPELRDTRSALSKAPSARPLVKGAQGRRLALRHAINAQVYVF